MRNPSIPFVDFPLPSALPSGSGCPPCEAWRLGWMFSELMVASAYNIASRTAWLGGALPGVDPAGSAALREWQRMWGEKMAAGLELGLAMQRAGYDLMLGRLDPWTSGAQMLRPFHGRTVSNALRLGRRAGFGT